MLRSPNVLAAMADAALPRLLPHSVAAIPTRITDRYQQALVESVDGQAWTVRLSRTPAAAAAAEPAAAFAKLLAKRVPFEVPQIEGRMMLPDKNLVTVHRTLPGQPMAWRELSAPSSICGSIGRALAALHDVDPRVADEAGVPSYDADSYRARRLATLDRAASTGLVPSALLARWERALEEVSLWRFPTCITHGTLEGQDVFADDQVRGIAAWENAAVSDPADDFAALWVLAPSEAFDTILETYSAARAEAPDKHLEMRIRLCAELQRVTVLLDAVAADDDALIDRRAAALRRLNEQTVDDDGLVPPAIGAVRRGAISPSTDFDPDDQLDDQLDDDPAPPETESEHSAPGTKSPGFGTLAAQPPVGADERDEATTEPIETGPADDGRTPDPALGEDAEANALHEDETVEIAVKRATSD